MSAINSVRRTTPVDNCIFCGEKNPTSEEHILSAWIYRAFEKAGLPHQEYTNIIHTTPFGEVEQAIRVKTIDATAPIFCNNCNLQWGKKLQDKASQVMKMFILGGWRKLEAKDIQKINRWYISYLMVREMYHNNHETHFQNERVDFRKRGIYPKNLSLWIAPLKNLNLDTVHRPLTYFSTTGRIFSQAHINVQSVGHLLFVSYGGNPPLGIDPTSQEYIRVSDYLNNKGFVQLIHPSKTFTVNFPENKPNYFNFKGDLHLCDDLTEFLVPSYTYTRKINHYWEIWGTLPC